jgi:hypothetical protein
MREAIIKRAYDAFRADIEAIPALTLRGANALDSGDSAPLYDAVVDQPTDTYLSTHAYWGLIYLDTRSWWSSSPAERGSRRRPGRVSLRKAYNA